MLVIPETFDSESSNLNFEVFRLTFANFTRLTAVKTECGLQLPGGTLGISGWGCAAGTLEPLTYTRASSAEFCYPILG